MTANLSCNGARFCVALIASCFCSLVHAQKNDLYESFVAAQATGEKTLLPDYSYAGYHHCEKELPKVTPESHQVFNVTKFGAIPNDDRSDRDAALAALEAAHAHSGSAVVYFPRGEYLLNEESDLGKPPLEIKRSGIVLKGRGIADTRLRFSKSPLFGQPLIQIRSSSGKQGDYWRGDRRLGCQVVQQVDQFRVRVSDGAKLKPGMRVNLNAKLDTHQPSTADYFAPHEVLSGVRQHANGVINDIFELHQIKEVDGNIVTFVAPLHLEVRFFTDIQIFAVENTVEECGVEDMSLIGNFHQQFKHHNGSRVGEDYRMIKLDRAFHCWIRRVRLVDYSDAIGTWLTGFCTFRDIVMEGNAGHKSVSVNSSYGNLFAYLRENTDTHHGLGVARSACNSVFLRCVQYANLEAHGGFPRATLYDCNEGRFSPRGGGASFFPHHDKGLTFWNWRVTEPGRYDFWPTSNPYGYFMPPVVSGLHGEDFKVEDDATDLLAYESRGRLANPASLFEAQLALRLGGLPEWLRKGSEAFEGISRHSRIEIVSPKNQSQTASKAIEVQMRVPDQWDPRHIRRVELLASSNSLWTGFRRLRQTDPKSLTRTFEPPYPGVWVLRARLTNVRGEVTSSLPVVIHFRSKKRPEFRPAVEWTMIPGKERVEIYKDFVKNGGGEAAQLPESSVLKNRKKDAPWYRFEKDYFGELQRFYKRYSQETMREVVGNPDHIQAASVLFDNNPNTTASSLYHSVETLVQAKFSQVTTINRLEIHWKENGKRNPRSQPKPVRFELQTSTDFPACWTSVVNDEPLWEPSVARLGGTLRKSPLPRRGNVSTIYFPARKAQAVRLLLVSFPNDAISELRFYGESEGR